MKRRSDRSRKLHLPGAQTQSGRSRILAPDQSQMADRPPSLRKQLTSLVFGKKLKAAANATNKRASEELPRSLREWLATEAVSEQINNAVAEALFAGLSRGRVSLAKEDEIPQLLEQSGGGKQLRALLMQGNVVDTLDKALQGGVAQLVAASVDGEPSTLRSQRAVSPEPSLSTSSVTATMADHRFTLPSPTRPP